MNPRLLNAIACALVAAASVSTRAWAQSVEPGALPPVDAVGVVAPPSSAAPVETALPAAAPPVASPYVFGPAQGYGEPTTPRYAPAPRPAPTPPKPSRQLHLGVDVGARGVLVSSAGFDPYAEGNFLPMLAVGATWSPLRFGSAALGLAAEYDLGARSGTARGAEASLVVHHATLGVRMEWTATRWLMLHLKAAPGMTHVRGSLKDGSLSDPLTARNTGFALDAMGGAAFRLGYSGHPELPRARFWLLTELGYSFSTPVKMAFSPDVDADDPRRFGSVKLPDLRVAGATGRVAFAVTF